jgi:hypothetical protein
MTEKVSESLPFEPPEQENIRLREENARLRRLLAVHSIPIPQLAPENRPPTKTVETAPPVDKEERARKRIALFRSLFRGREDVYARRWKNDDGRSGYVPAAVKDWKAINKSRPERCARSWRRWRCAESRRWRSAPVARMSARPVGVESRSKAGAQDL